ncbi:hypothetical protein KAU33_00910 [Candidatus Dependentiae bacterium]|nr:hypothetical protein [Candidatus Dependentiae bacterium]
MNNKNFEEEIVKYLEGELNPEKSKELEEELISQKKERLLRVLKDFSSPNPGSIPEPSPFMEARLFSRLKRAKKKKNVLSFLLTPIKIPSLVLVIILILFLTLTVNLFKRSSTPAEELQEIYQEGYALYDNGEYDVYSVDTDDSFAAAYFDTLTFKNE